MIAIEPVSSSLADLREMPLTEMAALTAGTGAGTPRWILPRASVARQKEKFSSTI